MYILYIMPLSLTAMSLNESQRLEASIASIYSKCFINKINIISIYSKYNNKIIPYNNSPLIWKGNAFII